MLHDTTQSLAYATMAQMSADGTSAAHSTLHIASFSAAQQPHAESVTEAAITSHTHQVPAPRWSAS